MTYETARRRTWELLEREIGESRLDYAVDLFITLLIVFNVLAVMAETVAWIGEPYVENEAQPQQFSSIPASMWWGVATLTTVGYGDVYPVTTAGRFIGAGIATLGVGLLALPTGILASGFSEELQKRRRREAAPCPHCGRDMRELPARAAGGDTSREGARVTGTPAERI